jgi:hypothetical protein
VEAGQDHVLIGAEHIFEDAENFHVHGFGLGAFKDRVGHAMEATVHFR